MDRLRLEQTLLLVLNAIQACEEGGKVIIGVRGAPGEGGIDFAIEDIGPGISPEDLLRIFEPFFTTRIDGTGLGLANARKIIEEHDGDICVATGPKAERGSSCICPPSA